ncbi:ATP synthase subunit delta, mitochondrial [Halotydeus destructor]|nr:ATP synthase subunit delta, mitochondrial [Halotydeus destructor]
MSALRIPLRALARSTITKNSLPIASRGYADAKGGMSFTFASPYDVYYANADIKQVDVPSYSGNFGILANHVPILAVLKPGVVTVYENDGSKKFFVSSGTITVNEDSTVQVLAEEAVPVEWLDANQARDALSTAQSQLASASNEQAKAEAQIAVEVSEALVKASE